MAVKILGSASPRRAELFKKLFPSFQTICVSDELEPELGMSPGAFVVHNATYKAKAILQLLSDKRLSALFPVESQLHVESQLPVDSQLSIDSCGQPSPEHSFMLFTFDTVVFIGQDIFGKPQDRADAFRMLKLFSGRSHSVATGYCVYENQNLILQDFEQTEVFFQKLEDSLIEAYLDTAEFTDKAGAYGIQGYASKLVKGIDGCYFNVMGLPVSKLFFQLRDKIAIL